MKTWRKGLTIQCAVVVWLGLMVGLVWGAADRSQATKKSPFSPSFDIKTFARNNSDLPSNIVTSLAVQDGALWVGTIAGLARFHQGNWQIFQQEPGKLPDNKVTSLAVQDGALWVGTYGGLAHFQPPRKRPIFVEMVPKPEDKTETLTQPRQTMAALAFDPNYHTDFDEFGYCWTISQKSGGEEPKVLPPTVIRKPFFTYTFKDGQDYVVSVEAIDKYGYRSKPQTREIRIDVPKPPSPLKTSLWQAFKALGGGVAPLPPLALPFGLALS